ncbi:MAG: metallophosphoesterase [Wenzhouxiangellaceae bacterium]|nr:metallophosphoesterase [Wenzhouxiangellaceae bacterium]
MSAPAFRLIQVSDCHLAADPGADYRGQNPDANLARMAGPIRRWRPDLVMLTGDLSEDASPASFERVRDWAAALALPVAWIPGNHDDRKVMAPLFDRAGFGRGPVLDAGAWQLALLDSTWPGDPAGELDDERLAPLGALSPGRPAGVFVHHQPVEVGAPWIDKVGMRARGRLWRRLEGDHPVRFVAFGHVHQRFRRTVQGVEVLACPSTAANTVPATRCFTPGETTPVARWFVLEQERFRTGYLAVS